MKKIILFTLFTLLTLQTQRTIFSQWYQQTLPVSGTIDDIAFLNKDTGFVAMGNNSILLRTLNGGTNWSILNNFKIGQLDKIDSVTIYGLNNYSGNKLYRSYDGGTTWDSVGVGGWCGMSFIDKDTGYISAISGIYKTTNGGLTVQFLSNQTSCGTILFLKQPYNGQYYGWNIDSGPFLYKTTNSGINWTNINNVDGPQNLFFLNKDTGWLIQNNSWSANMILHTTNGCVSWDTQRVVGSYSSTSATNLFAVNSQLVWAGNYLLNIVHATTNGGLNWGTQSANISRPIIINLVDSLLGWAGYINIAKTTNGGGPITYSGIDSNRKYIPVLFELKQNYPNPFNPQTTIQFSVIKSSYISLTVYDIQGREVIKIYNNDFLKTGNYKTVLDFSKINLSSGVYFYELKVQDENSSEIYKKTRKMIYAK